MCKIKKFDTMVASCDYCVGMLKASEMDHKQRLWGIRTLTWSLIDGACGSLAQEPLNRDEIDTISIVILDRLGYNASMFEEVAAVIEAAVPTDDNPMGGEVTRRLKSWRALRAYQAEEAAEPASIIEAIPPAIKQVAKKAGDRRKPVANKSAKKEPASVTTVTSIIAEPKKARTKTSPAKGEMSEAA